MHRAHLSFNVPDNLVIKDWNSHRFPYTRIMKKVLILPKYNSLLVQGIEQLLKNQSSTETMFCVSLDHPRPRYTAIWYGQIVWSPSISIPNITYHSGGGGGLSQKRGGGFSGLNDKPDTSGHPYLTIPYTSQFPKEIPDWMRWITRETIQILPVCPGSPVYGEVHFLPTVYKQRQP
jgi:hypothetical protein